MDYNPRSNAIVTKGTIIAIPITVITIIVTIISIVVKTIMAVWLWYHGRCSYHPQYNAMAIIMFDYWQVVGYISPKYISHEIPVIQLTVV